MGAAVSSADVVLREYQVEAVEQIVRTLRSSGRAQVRHACGTGKSIVAIRAAEELCEPGGIVVVLCPTLGLVAQTVDAWARVHRRPFTAIAVASDETVVDGFSLSDVPCDATTDALAVVDWLTCQTSSVRLIVGTHRSAGVVGTALLRRAATASVLILDEAHHTAGTAGKHSALVHDDDQFPATRRLYLTATPRVLLRGTDGAEIGAGISMDDERVFGPVVHEYPFSRAIDEGWIDDYRIAAIGVKRSKALDFMRELEGSLSGPTAKRDADRRATIHDVAVQIALGIAAERWDLRRVIAFCPRISDARGFARMLPRTMALTAPETAQSLCSEYVSGRHSGEHRGACIQRLAEPPDSGWTVLANARVLSEGIDVPAVDGVVFTHPRKSTIDVVQAVGRALRRHPEARKTATILVPILLPDDPGDLEAIKIAPEFDMLWNIVLALRAHDELLASTLDAQRRSFGAARPVLPAQIELDVPSEFVAEGWHEAISVRLIRVVTSSWWEGLGAATMYRRSRGDLNVPANFVNYRGFKLGQWIATQRSLRRSRLLSTTRVDELTALGVDWAPRESSWEENVAACRAFHQEHGHLRVVRGTRSGSDRAMATWLADRRAEARAGRLSTKRVQELAAIDPYWNEPGTGERLAAARALQARTGSLDVGDRHRESGVDIADWLRTCRRMYNSGTLSQRLVADLTVLGMRWEVPARGWEAHFRIVEEFHAAHGHLRIPPEHTVNGLIPARWLTRQRWERNGRRLSASRQERLEQLGMEWDQRWSDGMDAAREFSVEHGHLRVPIDCSVGGMNLSNWIEKRRRSYWKGELSAARSAELEALGMDWSPRSSLFERGVEAARSYHAEFGDLNPPARFCDDSGFALGVWLRGRRRRAKAGVLASHQQAALDAIDAQWATPLSP